VAQLGRISGQVLENNLLRQNVNLDFRNLNASTPLLKFDVQNNLIGVNTSSPSQLLTVNSTANATNLLTTNSVTVNNFSITNTGIDALSGTFTVNGATGVNATGIGTDQLIIRDNRIYSYVSDAPVTLSPNASGTIGALVHTLDNPNAYSTSSGDQFGEVVAIDGNSAIVGAPWEDDAGGFTSGKAYIFNVTSGALVHTLDNPNAYSTSSGDFFAGSVAISGNYAIVGARGEDEAGGNNSGKAYIFNVTSGALVHTLDNPNAYSTSTSDRFGDRVAISGNSAIVGAYIEDDAGGFSSGKAYIFNVTSGALVHTLDNPTAYGTSANDYFGSSVAISGNYAIVGAYQEDDAGGSSSGKAYIFNVTSGALVHTLDNPNAYSTSGGDRFGSAVAISGNSAIVGAWGEDDAGGFSSGKVYIYNVTSGALVHTLDNPTAYSTSSGDTFGSSVAISGNLAIVGAYQEDDAGGSSSGKAYIFNVTSGALVSTIDNPNAYGTSADDDFSYQVAISGNSVIVGADGEDDAGGSQSGKAYIYKIENTIELLTNTNVTGNLHATGNITANGNIVIGNDDNDSLTLSGELVTDIIPDATATYNLGSTSKRWSNSWVKDVTSNVVTADLATIDGVSLTQTQGNIVYISKNGSDTNTGTHQNDTVLTLEKAITLVSAGDTIHIYPGTYVETFPLTIPVGVTVTGEDMRNVILTPTGATESNDAFLINGEVTIENLTIKDFYYNSGADTGYGFRYTASSVVTSRSPYIRNCTVITKGSVTSVSDPRGFAQGDAGRGALVDGASVTTSSKEAGMLFHAATFITPGQQGLTSKNGARIEWLNSFTYFASIGIVTEQGSTGLAGQGVKYGSEIRCIGSANVYGTKAIVADGAGTLIYLVNHNFGYIGVGKDVTNDKTLHIQANEVTKLNSAVVVFTSLDHGGVYRVGSALEVNQETGETVIDSTNFDFSGVEKLTISTGGQSVQLKGEKVETDFIKFSGSTLETIVGELTLDAGGGDFNFTSNTNISGNLDVTGNVTLGGTLVRLGNADTDKIDFNADIEGNLIPNLNSFSLGRNGKQWNTIHASNIDLDNLSIQGNKIKTDESNADLELDGNGSFPGHVYFTATDVLGTVTTTATSGRNVFTEANINGQLTVTGNLIGSGTSHTLRQISTSSLVANSSNNLTTFDNISFNGNQINTTTGNDDLNLDPSGTGKVNFLSNLDVVNLIAPSASVSIANASGLDKVVGEELLSQNIILTGDAVIEDIAIADNMISTRTSNSDLVLKASGAGTIRFQEDVILTGDVITPATSTVASTSTGNLGANRLIVQTLNSENKQIIFEDVMFAGNRVTSTDSNSDLEFRANGSGIVRVKENFIASNDLTVGKITSLQATTINNTLTVDTITATNISGVGSSIFEGVSLSGNVISTKDSDANLELRANGTGKVTFGENVVVENDVTVSGTTTIGSINVQNTFETLNFNSVNLNISGTSTLKSNIDKVRISGNTINTIVTDTDLELRASGSGVISMNENVVIPNNITVSGTLNTKNINIQNDVDLGSLEVLGNIQINDNFVETTVSDSDLELRANGSGIVDYNGLSFSSNILTNTTGNLQLDPTDILKINTTGSILLSKGTTAQRSGSPTVGTVRYNTTINQFVGYGPTTNVVLSSALLSDNYQTGIELSSIGISNDLNFKINGSIVSKFTSNNKTEFNKVELSGMTLDSNNLTVTSADTDLTLDARHARVAFDKLQFSDLYVYADNATVSFANTGQGSVKFNDNKALVLPAGNSAGRETSPELGHTRYNTELAYLEVFTGGAWTTAVGSGGAASAADMADVLNTYTIIFG